MSTLKSNFPTADRCVVGSNKIRTPNTVNQSGITWSKNNSEHVQHAPTAGVQIGLGVEPMKLNKARTNRKFNNSVSTRPLRGRFNG